MSAATSGSTTRKQVLVRLHPDVKERLDYWAAKRGVAANEYITDAIEAAIARENGDYDLPTLEIARLNQLVDQMAALSTNAANLEKVVTSGFDSLLGLTRGDNYLLDGDGA